MWDALNLRRQRRLTAGAATGRVLELGVGSGANLRFYDRAEALVGLDVDGDSLRRARAVATPVPVELVEADAQALPFEDATFDTVVAGLSLCTIPDPVAALREARRVLRPGGRLLFLEHVRARSPWAAWLQDRLERPWMRVAGGCHPNRDTLAAVEREFEIEQLWRKGVLVRAEATPRA